MTNAHLGQTTTGGGSATVEGLVGILELFGYLNLGRPTWKAAYLRSIFDTNALTLSELLYAPEALDGLPAMTTLCLLSPAARTARWTPVVTDRASA